VTTTVAGSDAFETLNFNFQAPLLGDSAVRQAVARCVPRQDILDKLVKPTDAHAVLQENRMLFPAQDGYTDTSRARYDAVDIPAARATLAADGWTLDGDVFAKSGQRLEFKLLHSATRTDEAQLIEASCAKAGISVVDDSDPKWSTRLGGGQFDAVLFTWITNPTLSSELVEDANQADTQLWNDLATIPLWQYPQVTAYSDHVHGVRPNPTQQGLTWNIETWTLS
jgi:peptide/nickel transport system substrate-binding protein